MTRVCLIALYSYKLFHPQDKAASPFSGSEVQQYLLGTELAKDNNFDVSFFVGDFCRSQPKYEEINFGGKIIELYKTVNCGKRNNLIDGLMDFWKIFQAMRQAKADTYVILGGGSFAGKVAIMTKLFKKSFIYSSAHDRDSDGSYSKKQPWYIYQLFLHAFKNADTVICQHVEQQKAFKKNLGIDATIINAMYPIATESTITNYQSRHYVLWVGRLITWKQPELYVNLAKIFPSEKFLLITNSKTVTLENIDKVKNLEIKVQVPFDQIDYYFKHAKIFINTSTQEGFPNTFVQAAKNGTPIVSLNVDPNKMLNSNGMGYCANGNKKDLFDATEEILHNNNKWHNMSQKAFDYAVNNHDIKLVIEQHKKIIISSVKKT